MCAWGMGHGALCVARGRWRDGDVGTWEVCLNELGDGGQRERREGRVTGGLGKRAFGIWGTGGREGHQVEKPLRKSTIRRRASRECCAKNIVMRERA